MLSDAEVVGRYELVRLLGQGAYCSVYEARERSSGDRIALKQLKRVGAVSLAHFKREFRLVQGMHHRNLVNLRELFEWKGGCFIAMELVDGDDLTSFLRQSGPDARVDYQRLRDSFEQLAGALIVLHEASVVHRDIKPRNVLVTQAGRVVLLDFGLATVLEPHAARAPDPVGTAAYMAPEQASGATLGPAADLYALGACLYEALTGAPPFSLLSAAEMLHAKQHRLPPAPSSLAPETPADLDRLCMRLLESDPSNRVSAAEVVRILSAHGAAARLLHAPPRDEFSGREHELQALADALERTRRGEFTLMLIEGESGIGKSGLVAEFVRALREREPQALVLRSRCYENDLLAYKAFDGGVEQLARVLAALDRAVCEALLPERAALLPRLFAAFSTVAAIAQAPTRALPAEPTAQRLAGFSALCALLARLGQRFPVVIEIDDLQWADAESFRLLRAIGEDPQRPALLVVATVRPASELVEPAASALLHLRQWPQSQNLHLQGLDTVAARTLARALLADHPSDALVSTLVTESGGHPLLLSELAHYAQSRGLRSAPQRITLDEAVQARIEALQPDAQQLMFAVALASRPYPAQVFALALRLAPDVIASLASELLAQRLLRRRRGHELVCYHDRIRHVAQRLIDAPPTRALHGRLAEALAARPDSDPSELAAHHDAAGQFAAAIAAYARAGEHALASLAFARAEQLCERALELARTEPAPLTTLSTLALTRGHALARGGRSAEAAQQYLQLAQSAEGQEKTQLRIWATQHLLQSARVEEGLAAARSLLAELGVPMPSNSASAFARMLWDRTWSRLSSSDAGRPPSPISMRARMQLDALWQVALPLSWLDPIASTALSVRHLRLARALHEPSHMARALVEQALLQLYGDPDAPQVDRLLERARTLFDAKADPALDVSVALREATVSSFRFDLPRARERLEHAHAIATESCPDQPWLVTNVRINVGVIWVYTGNHAQLAAATTQWLAEAHDRNDRFAMSLIEGLGGGSTRHLMADDPELARAALAAALDPWPREPFTFAHGGEFVGIVHAELYRGGDGAYVWLQGEMPRLSRAFLHKIGFGKATLQLWRALACLAARNVAGSARARSLLLEARRLARALGHSPTKLTRLNAMSLQAQLETVSGDRQRALGLVREARLSCEQCGFTFLARSLEYLEGLLEPATDGAAKRTAALGFFEGEGWKQPRRALCIWCPAIDALEGR